MHEGGFLRDLTVILGFSLPILFACRKAKLPPILGFLLSGVLVGPSALAFVREPARVEEIAELGIVLLLFFVGLEFPVHRLRQLGRDALLGGPLQMGITAAVAAAGARLDGFAWGPSVFVGLLVSISSTAVLLPVLAARDELGAPHARRFVGVSLFQDLGVIPLILVLPLLAGGNGPGAGAVLVKVGVAVVALALLVVVSHWAVPRVLAWAARLGSREGFTGAIVILVLLVVFGADRAGVSAAMGAFVAGLVLAETELVHEVVATLAPFRDLLSSLFFVSIGMLLDPRLLMRAPLAIAGVTVAVLVLKTAGAFAALRLIGVVPRTALRAALLLATVGEFSFVLARAGKPLGLVGPGTEEVFVATAVLTLALAPALVAAAPALARLLPDRPGAPVTDEGEASPVLSGHVVVAGYGLNGRNVARVLRETRLAHVVIDGEPDRVDAARRAGSRAVRGDVAAVETLLAAGVPRALGLVIALSDPEATRRAVRLARRKAPGVRIVVRTRYVAEVEPLRALGADEVIPEEFETSIEIVTRVLRLFRVPGNVVAAQLRVLRDETYRVLRDPDYRASDGRRLSALLAAGTTELFLVLPDTLADGRVLGELEFASDHVTVPALLRDGAPFAPPPLEMTVRAGDTLLLVGAHDDLSRAVARLEKPRDPAGAGDPVS